MFGTAWVDCRSVGTPWRLENWRLMNREVRRTLGVDCMEQCCRARMGAERGRKGVHSGGSGLFFVQLYP